MLSYLLLVPFLGALVLIPMSDSTPSERSRVKLVAMSSSLVALLLAVLVWQGYDSSVGGYQMMTSSLGHVAFISPRLGVDAVSVVFVVLTAFLTPICLLASWYNIRADVKLYMVFQLLIEGLLLVVFTVTDLLLFYVAFESVLVPLFLVVGIWGGSATRVRSALLLFLYTLAGSLFMLLAIMVMYANVGSTDFVVLSSVTIHPYAQRVLWLAFFLALAVKTPLVPFHVWLPRAHADAPLAGSMVLAGTVLKLATYGFLRIVLPLLPDATSYFAPTVQAVAVITLVYSSLATLRQVDFKALVAYSSVSHMAIVVLGIFSNTLVGIEGGIVLALAHGVISPALFMLVGGVLYDRYHTRVIRYYRGVAQTMPVFALLFFLATSCNMGVPLSLNWASELMALSGIFQRSPVVGVLGASSIVLSACYSIWLWTRIVGGAYSPHLTYGLDVTRRETLILAALIVPALVLGVLPNAILGDLHATVTTLLFAAG